MREIYGEFNLRKALNNPLFFPFSYSFRYIVVDGVSLDLGHGFHRSSK